MSGAPTIVGAGLAGLIAAHAWPTAQVLEATAAPRSMHRALLRFRTPAVGNLVGVEFRRVLVRKGLWAEGSPVTPAIHWANLYARKVLRRSAPLGERSVWALDPAERYVAPDDLYERLVDAVGARVRWGAPATDWRSGARAAHPYVSTAPLPATLAACGVDVPVGTTFTRAAINVDRWRVPGADVYQTIYFPALSTPVYRASITGATLIVESVDDGAPVTGPIDDAALDDVFRAFGLDRDGCQPLERVQQRFGKIAPIDDSLRKHLLFRLTTAHNVFSLGRFATWRNILLDDVVGDIAVLKRLMVSHAAGYDAMRVLKGGA